MDSFDALNFLSRTRIQEFERRRIIYEPDNPPAHLYLVLSGRVKILCAANDGAQTLLRVVPPEGFFGECALLPAQDTIKETAIALDTARAMAWPASEMQQQIEREPKLALALFQYFGKRNIQLRDRLKAAGNFTTGPRVILALVQLAHEIGASMPDGAVRLSGLTHQAIADYVGTSREIVTSEMNRLRRLGYVAYSRLHTDIFLGSLEEWMSQQHPNLKTGAPTAAVRATI
jgi:CRP/FNR family transcriptional regulator